jgi:hypothetical protein
MSSHGALRPEKRWKRAKNDKNERKKAGRKGPAAG